MLEGGTSIVGALSGVWCCEYGPVGWGKLLGVGGVSCGALLGV